MAKKFNQIYQFKITLEEIKQKIWRRIQVPGKYNFWDLHVAIQDAMGWSDSHLHQFELINSETGKKEIVGIPEHEYGEATMDDYETLAGWELKLDDYFTIPDNEQIPYLYDFGDSWRYLIKFEGIYPRNENKKYPLCLDGERACPPEDCGGVGGYENFLEIINNPQHEEHQSMLEWVGGSFDSEKFNPQNVHFDNPKKRWKIAFEA